VSIRLRWEIHRYCIRNCIEGLTVFVSLVFDGGGEMWLTAEQLFDVGVPEAPLTWRQRRGQADVCELHHASVVC
jgi:hypothetical protein